MGFTTAGATLAKLSSNFGDGVLCFPGFSGSRVSVRRVVPGVAASAGAGLFAEVPSGVLFEALAARRISAVQARLYLALAARAGRDRRCRVRQEAVGGLCGLSRSSAHRGLHALARAGLVEFGTYQHRHSYWYRIVWPESEVLVGVTGRRREAVAVPTDAIRVLPAGLLTVYVALLSLVRQGFLVDDLARVAELLGLGVGDVRARVRQLRREAFGGLLWVAAIGRPGYSNILVPLSQVVRVPGPGRRSMRRVGSSPLMLGNAAPGFFRWIADWAACPGRDETRSLVGSDAHQTILCNNEQIFESSDPAAWGKQYVRVFEDKNNNVGEKEPHWDSTVRLEEQARVPAQVLDQAFSAVDRLVTRDITGRYLQEIRRDETTVHRLADGVARCACTAKTTPDAVVDRLSGLKTGHVVRLCGWTLRTLEDPRFRLELGIERSSSVRDNPPAAQKPQITPIPADVVPDPAARALLGRAAKLRTERHLPRWRAMELALAEREKCTSPPAEEQSSPEAGWPTDLELLLPPPEEEEAWEDEPPPATDGVITFEDLELLVPPPEEEWEDAWEKPGPGV